MVQALVVMDTEACFAAATSRDARFDGVFILAVTTTRIYCRPSCPALMPKRSNCRFYRPLMLRRRRGFDRASDVDQMQRMGRQTGVIAPMWSAELCG